MITIIFYAINKSRANEPQKKSSCAPTSFWGAHSRTWWLFCSCCTRNRLIIIPGLSMSWTFLPLNLGYRCPGLWHIRPLSPKALGHSNAPDVFLKPFALSQLFMWPSPLRLIDIALRKLAWPDRPNDVNVLCGEYIMVPKPLNHPEVSTHPQAREQRNMEKNARYVILCNAWLLTLYWRSIIV